MVKIEIDGKELEVRQGQMIIEATDRLGIKVPRFCYHKKLSIAANCRMCLVDVANAPKPLPACATPVSDGMKISTKSARAVDAQKAVMEFLLINHPLDCPICDQGGQCELQDVALEYGKDASRYIEGKRAVEDKNIGPLISTEMTRCIHCTRCVRFGAEIAGERELGATGRGEFMEIGTYIEKSVNSEISGNVIDLCPVGALTSKPFRFGPRAWELRALPSVSPHDSLGSNLFFHTLRDKVMRTLPRENEEINEVWLSDRDRFSYEGLNHPDRLTAPQIKRDGQWQTVEWSEALAFAVEKLENIIKTDPASLGVIASPNSTLEEFYLLQKLFRALGCYHIDHRLREVDNAHQAHLGSYPRLGITLSDLQSQRHIILVGSDIRKEQPLLAHRVRKATLQGAHVIAVNPWHVDFNFECGSVLVGERADMIQPLLEIIKAMTEVNPACEEKIPSAFRALLSQTTTHEQAKKAAQALCASEKASVILGAYAISHPEASKIYALSRLLADLIGATWGEMSQGANGAGGWLAGAVPHRLPMGEPQENEAFSAQDMWQQPRKGYVLLHCEPEFDTAAPRFAIDALKQAESVIVLSAYDNPLSRVYADVLLPVTPISEMAGTYVNALGDWQSFQAAVKPLGESRPAWKVLRVLGNLCDVRHFHYENVGEVLQEILNHPKREHYEKDSLLKMPDLTRDVKLQTASQLIRIAPTPLYAVDSVTRRARSLQETLDAKMAVVRIHSEQAKQQQLIEGQKVWVMQDGMTTLEPLPIEIDDRLPVNTALVASSLYETQSLGEPFGMIQLIAVEDE